MKVALPRTNRVPKMQGAIDDKHDKVVDGLAAAVKKMSIGKQKKQARITADAAVVEYVTSTEAKRQREVSGANLMQKRVNAEAMQTAFNESHSGYTGSLLYMLLLQLSTNLPTQVRFALKPYAFMVLMCTGSFEVVKNTLMKMKDGTRLAQFMRSLALSVSYQIGYWVCCDTLPFPIPFDYLRFGTHEKNEMNTADADVRQGPNAGFITEIGDHTDLSVATGSNITTDVVDVARFLTLIDNEDEIKVMSRMKPSDVAVKYPCLGTVRTLNELSDISDEAYSMIACILMHMGREMASRFKSDVALEYSESRVTLTRDGSVIASGNGSGAVRSVAKGV